MWGGTAGGLVVAAAAAAVAVACDLAAAAVAVADYGGDADESFLLRVDYQFHHF